MISRRYILVFPQCISSVSFVHVCVEAMWLVQHESLVKNNMSVITVHIDLQNYASVWTYNPHLGNFFLAWTLYKEIGIWFDPVRHCSMLQCSAEFKEKCPVCSLRWGALQWCFFLAWNAFFSSRNFHFGRPKTNFNSFKFQKVKAKKKKKRKKKSSATPTCYATGALWSSCLCNFSFSSLSLSLFFFFFFFFVGALRIGGSCQQLLILLTFKSATVALGKPGSLINIILTLTVSTFEICLFDYHIDIVYSVHVPVTSLNTVSKWCVLTYNVS